MELARKSNVTQQAQDIASLTSRPIPLIIDLDGSLCRTDTLHETVLGLIAEEPLTLAHLPGWAAKGKEYFKQKVSDRKLLDPALLPYDEKVLALIHTARAEGQPIALVSAAQQQQVDAVATHLGLFDEAIGTNGAAGHSAGLGNLRGEAKARLLVDRYGEGGFDYLGDSVTDLPVWKAARKSYGVRLSKDTRQAASTANLQLTRLDDTEQGWPVRALIRACRPHQWAKNLLILLPVLTAQDLSRLPAALLAMLCFSLTASAIYIINDLIDLPSDRIHPRKQMRPFASGAASAVQGLAVSGGLLVLAVFLATLFLPADFLAILLLYLVATSAYSLWIKRKMMVDVIGLATLYTLRIVAGAAATGIALSPWLLVFSMFLFFALATIKRQAELEDLAQRGLERSSGRNLITADLPILQAMSISAAQAAVLVFALYAHDPAVQDAFGSPGLLLLICPVLFLWLGRMQLMTRRGYMNDDPIVFTIKDRVSLACGVIMLVIFAIAARGHG